MKFLIGILSVILFVSCGKNECDSNCDPLLPIVNFKIVNSSGQNLVSGANKIYNLNQIAIKEIVNNVLVTDSIGFNGDGNLATTPLSFAANSGISQYYLYINNAKTDSFQVSYQLTEGKTSCCPSFTALTALKLNNVATSYTYPGNATPFNIVK